MLRMPYGLRNSQATQQRYMDQVLKDVPKASAYVDDILLHSETFDQHLKSLDKCLSKISQCNLSLRLDKCVFCKDKVEQFGFYITSNGIEPTDQGVNKIKQYPRPKDVREVKRFLGMANYYRDSFQDYQK